MTFRIGIEGAPNRPGLVFQGLLDRVALRAVEAQVRGLSSSSSAAVVCLLLLEGTEIDPECIAGLQALPGVEVQAASGFLARWLAASARLPP